MKNRIGEQVSEAMMDEGWRAFRVVRGRSGESLADVWERHSEEFYIWDLLYSGTSRADLSVRYGISKEQVSRLARDQEARISRALGAGRTVANPLLACPCTMCSLPAEACGWDADESNRKKAAMLAKKRPNSGEPEGLPAVKRKRSGRESGRQSRGYCLRVEAVACLLRSDLWNPMTDLIFLEETTEIPISRLKEFRSDLTQLSYSELDALLEALRPEMLQA